MGGVVNTVKSVVKQPGRAIAAGLTGGLSEFGQQNPYGMPLPFKNPLNVAQNAILGMGDDQPAIPGPFSVDANQLEGDKRNILNEGQNQYDQTLSAIDQNGQAQQEYANQVLKRMLPGIAEDTNARKVFNSSAYEQESRTERLES
jgi:hypothetical protein